jgi:dienelactone hydrolase
MNLSRRELFWLSLAGCVRPARARDAGHDDVHQQLLDLAARYEEERRARFAEVKTPDQLAELQRSLRETFVRLLGGLPEKMALPAVTKTGTIDADHYVVEKLVYESFPGYFVSALLYKPKSIDKPVPAVLSPCGHSVVGKAAPEYQTLHINLAKRGFVVLTYDPVGQGERSQFWDSHKGRTRFNLSCGEHAVLGSALDLHGTSLARYRIWDGMRGLDYLASLPEVNRTKLGCAGNSGGGTLTAYLTALDPRIAAAAICCYITTLPRRMGNRIQEDPSSDPEQDFFGFVSERIDHAGLLALCAPRPTLIGSAQLDFFPIEGAHESFAEAKRLYQAAGAPERIAQAESPLKHGLTQPLREAVYGWFGRWLSGRDEPAAAREIPVRPRTPEELRVCAEGQVSVSFRSRFLLDLAQDEFRKAPRPARRPLREVLRLEPDEIRNAAAAIAAGTGPTLVICINGNDARDWREQREFLEVVRQTGHDTAVVDPSGVGPRRVRLAVPGHSYTDPLSSVEANIAYNAYLVGRTMLGMRVADVAVAVHKLAAERKPRRVILCGRNDAALVACCAAAVMPAIAGVAVENMLLSFNSAFSAEGFPINAASIAPGVLRDFGDIQDVVGLVTPRGVLIAAGIGDAKPPAASVRYSDKRFTSDPRVLVEWL